ncbi:hypothetical protein Tco_0613145 [Tanacetum coccineum]
MVWTSLTGQDASVQTQDTSVDEAQHVAAPALSSQPAYETVPHYEIEEVEAEAEEEVEAKAHETNRAPKANVDCQLETIVPHYEIEEVEAQAETKVHGTDCALEANVDCFTNLRRSYWLQAVVVGAINGLLTPASMILDNTFPLTFNNIFEKEKFSNFSRIISRAATMAMGEYVSIRSQLDVKKRSGLNEKVPPNPCLPEFLSFAA